MKNRHLLKIVSFLIIAVWLFYGLNWFLQPVWLDWNNYDTIHGFYKEPENTIETLFLGASTAVNAFTPMELYEDYGICAYNLGTEQQPMLTSYYWLEEAYRFHSETLKNVVLECSMLRRTPQIAFYQKTIDHMKFSSIKYHAVKDYTEDFHEMLLYLVPIFSYHKRWASITDVDFEIINYKIKDYVRGYNFVTERYFNSEKYKESIISSYILDQEAEPAKFHQESLQYLEKIVNFCKEKGIRLILMKTPNINWSSSNHNAAAELAKNYKLDFLDFNFEPLSLEIDYNILDIADIDGHMNYYGASKLTSWFGKYLSEQCNVTDVRGNPKYSYMEKQLKNYYEQVLHFAKLNMLEDPCDYLLLAMEHKDYAIFIIGKDDSASSLREDQREGFASAGLEKLSVLGYRSSYLAVIENGMVLYELSDSLEIEKELSTEEQIESKIEEKELKVTPISYKGQLKNGSIYTLSSGGTMNGNVASCMIGGKEYAQNSRGLNIVIYDIKNDKLVDSVNFDTCASSIRDNVNMEVLLEKAQEEGKNYNELSKNLKNLYLYNYKSETLHSTELLKSLIKEDGLWDYLSAYWNQENRIIFLSAMDEAAGSFSEAARLTFEENGLHELAALGYRDSYLAVINNGQVLYERKDHGEIPIETKGVNYKMISGGMESGNVSSIQINNTEYSLKTRGINVVIYDTLLNEVVDKASFDTCAIPVHIDN